ncbi:MAG: BT1926 family outer membrane beta-barrel protein [Lutibacter sp.]
MKKYLILCFILVFALTSANAQDRDSEHHHYKGDTCKVGPRFAPQAGDFTVAMIFGRGAFLEDGLVVPSSTAAVSGEAPYDSTVEANDNRINNMVGGEARYYASNRFAITLSGAAIWRNTPSQLAIPAVIDGEGNTIIPAYNPVVEAESIDARISLGGQWLFNTKNDRLFPYVGFALPFNYARRSMFEPITIDSGGNLAVNDLGARHVDITAFGVQAVAGVDYYIFKDVFFGFDIKPVSYTYAVSTKTPGPGLFNLESDTNTLSFFAQFNFKVGFKF